MSRIVSLSLATGMYALLASAPALTQNLSIDSVQPADFGNVAAAVAGQTVLRANPANGSVSITSGSGSRLSTGPVRSLMTVSCGNAAWCDTSDIAITINQTGAPTNRAGQLQNFTVSTVGTTATIIAPPGSGNTISFTIAPIGRQSSKAFWVGFDLPIAGNDTGANSGLSTAQLAATAARANGGGSVTLTGQVSANVFRAMAISRQSNLQFGTISRPVAGSGSVAVSATTGTRSVTGSGVQAFPLPPPGTAQFQVSGEGGQSVSVLVPSSFNMSGSGGSISVTTTSTGAGIQTLSGGLGGPGVLNVVVGGSITLSPAMPIGTYTGTFQVTVNYN